MPTINSFIRLLHVSPGTPRVDVYADGNLIIKNLSYDDISRYLSVGPENMHIQIFAAGDNTTPLIDTEVTIPPSTRITVALIGISPDISLLPIFFNVAPRDTNDALLRFVNLAPNIGSLDVRVVNGQLAFNNVAYTQVTDFENITPGEYDVELRLSGEDQLILTDDVELDAGRAYTIYAFGLLGREPFLEIDDYEDLIPSIGKVDIKEKVSSTNRGTKITFIYA